MFIIGSKALNFFELKDDVSKSDTDFICTEEGYREKLKTLSVVHTESTRLGYTVFAVGHMPLEFQIDPELCQLVKTHKLHFGEFVNPEVVLALKETHKYLRNSPHFEKTRRDILMLRGWGYKVPACLKEWSRKRRELTYWYKHPSLKQSKQDFFVDSFYKWDHDDIHKSVAFYHQPAYEFYKKPDAEVECSRDLFFQVKEEIRLAGVLEECFVLALERHQIPNDFEPNPDISFKIALQKVCSSITSGWFRKYAWDKYDEVLEIYSSFAGQYVEKFKKDLSHGKIRTFNHGK